MGIQRNAIINRVFVCNDARRLHRPCGMDVDVSFTSNEGNIEMIYNEYGQTGVNVSAIGFGGMRFKDQEDVEDCVSVINAAYDAGINYFDTAAGYGKSEELFGEAFKEMKKTRAEKPFYVSTKTMKTTPEEVRRELETSLERMGLDYVDFYHFWCIMSLDSYRERQANGVLKEFEKFKEEGLVKHICVSSHMTGADVGVMMNEYPFEGVLLGYSAMNFAYRDAGVQAAADLNKGVVVMNPLAGGVIPNNPEKFDFVRTQEDETVVEGALRFLLNDSRITISLVGFSTVDQVDEAVRAVDGFEPFTAEDTSRIRDGLSRSFNELCTGCQYCSVCPEGIPVHKYLDAYNYFMLEGKEQAVLDRLNWHWGIQPGNHHLASCTKCGACEVACTQKLSIIDRLDEISGMIDRDGHATG